MPSERRRPREISDSDDMTDSRTTRRRSSRGNSSLSELAKEICLHKKRVVFITGAGLSVASGVRPFRGNSGVWTQFIWSMATRENFRRGPLNFYNDFWLACMHLPKDVKPNQGHGALEALLTRYSNLNLITQNVDGLHGSSNRIIEAHGRIGLYKCIPDSDSDTDSDDDDDDDRLVHLGHRRKRRKIATKKVCQYQQTESLDVDDVEPISTRLTLQSQSGSLRAAPRCPECDNALAPQALLFDEGYHSHDFYQFQRMEEWLSKAQVIVFVGTSFNVRLPEIALEHARAESIPVYNFNTQDFLESTTRLNAENIQGPSEETLPRLWVACMELQAQIDAASRSIGEVNTATDISPSAVLPVKA